MNELLRNLYLFKGLDPESIRRIDAITRLRLFEADEQIFTQGAEAKALFVIQHGTVKIAQTMADGSSVEVSLLGTGSHFGEMAFLDGHRRSASATASTASHIIEIGYQPLRELLDAEPTLAAYVYRELARFLCSRLRLTTEDLSFERHRKIVSHLWSGVARFPCFSGTVYVFQSFEYVYCPRIFTLSRLAGLPLATRSAGR